MARATRTKAAKPVEEEVEPETNGSAGLRPVGALHNHMADWLNEEYGEELDKPLTARQVQVVISKRNEYRKSDEYLEFAEERDAARAEAEETKAAAPAKKRGRPAKAEAEEEPAEEPKPARTRRTRAKAAPAEEAEEAPAPKTRTRRTRATSTETEEAAPAPARRSRRRAAPAANEAEPF